MYYWFKLVFEECNFKTCEQKTSDKTPYAYSFYICNNRTENKFKNYIQIKLRKPTEILWALSLQPPPIIARTILTTPLQIFFFYLASQDCDDPVLPPLFSVQTTEKPEFLQNTWCLWFCNWSELTRFATILFELLLDLASLPS